MYAYDHYDQTFVEQRAAEFREQIDRRLSGALSEDEFKPLRLQNGLYLQLHAYMLRVAIPYGVLNSKQLRMLGNLADRYDKGYGHFTTRQNIQYNWTKLSDVADMIDALASVQMHAIQTSGNCIRNVTTDAYAGVAGDEWLDPRPSAELLRQWSSLHPEFAFLPRKFKIAVLGAAQDRAAMKFHDIGLWAKLDAGGQPTYDIWVGGGQGRTPRVARLYQEAVPLADLLPTLDAMLRVYNLAGRRDNKYKARIKILIDEMGIEAYREAVDEELARIDRSVFATAVTEYQRIAAQFETAQRPALQGQAIAQESPAFHAWLQQNGMAHKIDGYAAVSISLKTKGAIPGDASGAQMRAVADLAERYSAGEIRVSHRQNLVLPWVKLNDLGALYAALVEQDLAEANIGLASDIIACPGLDYCALATARSIPVAQALSARLREREQRDGPIDLSLNISGCINACGHHHAANIGILGLNRTESETYQISLGGRADDKAKVGEILGPGFSQEQVPDVIETLLDTWQAHRRDNEDFSQTFERVGKQPFKEAVYA